MNITATAREILSGNHWEEFCEMRGINPWAMNEGLMEPEEVFEFTIEEAKELGLCRLKKKKEK